MPECSHIPEGRLSTYVKTMWFSEGYTPSSQIERVLPHGSSQLMINLGDQTFRHFEDAGGTRANEYAPVILAGTHTHNIFLDSYSRRTTIGLVLRPGATSAFFGIPANEFKNNVIALDTIVGSSVSSLRQRLIETNHPEDKFSLLESFLIRRLDRNFQPNPAIIYAVDQLHRQNGIPSIAEIRNNIGYSRRHFSELFKTITGITPKQYAKIQRFQHSLKVIRQSNQPDWTDLAIACGYYDQSHFIRNFKQLAGISPTDYHRNQGAAVNHLTV